MFPNAASAIIITLYHRHVEDVKQVLDHFTTFIEEAYDNEENRQFMAGFEMHLLRYLKGSGHPSHPDILSGALISAEEVASGVGDNLLHARMFMRAITTSGMIPLDEHWEIEVLIICLRFASSTLTNYVHFSFVSTILAACGPTRYCTSAHD